MKFSYNVEINLIKQGEIVTIATSSKIAEREARRLVKQSFELNDGDTINLKLVKIEMVEPIV